MLEKTFGKILRRLRGESKLTQEQLAFESGLDRTYISLLERGERVPTINTLAKLSGPLGKIPSEILKLIEQEDSENIL